MTWRWRYTNTPLREVQNPRLTASTHTHISVSHLHSSSHSSFSLLFPPAVSPSYHNSPSSWFTQTLSFLVCLNIFPFTHSSFENNRKKETHPLLHPAGSCWLKWQTENRRVFREELIRMTNTGLLGPTPVTNMITVQIKERKMYETF